MRVSREIDALTLLYGLLKRIYAPLLFASVLMLGVQVIESGLPNLSLIGIAIAAIGISFLVERIIPYHGPWNETLNDRKRDVLHFIVNEGSVLLGLLAVPLIAGSIPWDAIWPTSWPLLIQLVIAILIADAGITLAHYASHRISWLWQLHAIHHSVKRMYGFNGLMKHPVHQTIETVAGTTPLLLLGVPVEIASLLALSVSVQLLLQHSNVDMRVGALRYLWAVAPVHRFHHLNHAQAGDVNFGLFTTLWDRLLGTAFYEETKRFGSADIGIADQDDYPTAYLQQLIQPFRGSITL